MSYNESQTLPSISNGTRLDYTPETAVNNNILVEDGLTHEEKSVAITRLSRTDRCKTSEGEHFVKLSSTLYFKDGSSKKTSSKLCFSYSWVCQAGFYPENLNKPNQDNLLILVDNPPIKVIRNTPGVEYEEKEFALFAVFDGHGQFGTECATFAAASFPRVFSTHLSSYNNLLSRENIKNVMNQTLSEINLEMHKQKYSRKHSFNDLCSGTTAICVLLLDDEVITANVGDSRAVLGMPNYEQNYQKVKGVSIIPLSVDQTPFRKDERDRCRSSGGIIMSMDQMEGLVPYDPNQESWGSEEDAGVDPPRLWSTQQGSPGVAFTRSLGDEFVEQIGCIGTPEISSFAVPGDPFVLCAASDGIFEFLNSEVVAEILAQFQGRYIPGILESREDKSGVYEATKALIAEAYKLWLHYEVRTDDITAIVCFVHEIDMESEVEPAAKTKWNTPVEQRPVRRVISKEKRQLLRPIELNYDSDEDVDPASFPKTEKEALGIRDAIKTNFLFQHLTESQVKKVVQSFEKLIIEKNSVIIKQGEPGDKFYVVFEGKYDCYVKQKEDNSEGYGQLVHKYEAVSEGLGKPSFGELALMFSEPRAATIVAQTSGTLYSLDRRIFRRLFVKKTSNQEIVKLLRNVPIFQSLTRNQLQRLADAISLKRLHDGDEIITQGSLGDALYIVRTGNVRCVIDSALPPYNQKVSDSETDTTSEVMRISPGGYFGERALLYHEPRAANVYAVGEAEILCLSRSSFEKLLGPLQDVIQKHSKLREQQAKAEKCRQANLKQMLGEGGTIGYSSFQTLSTVAAGTDGGVSFKQGKLKNHKAVTLKSVSIEFAEANNLQDAVERDRFLHSICITEAVTTDDSRKSLKIDLDFNYSFIGRLLGSFVSDKELHMVLQVNLVGSLYDIVSDTSGNKLSEREACFICTNIISGLRFLHESAVLTRAINMSSLQLDESGVIILADLSMGKYLEDEFDRAYTMCGDKAYFAPEQILNRGADCSVDWWSLGLLLYELLYSKLPYVGNIQEETISDAKRFKLITDFDPSAINFDSSYSRECSDLILLLLQPDSSARKDVYFSVRGSRWFDKYSFDPANVEGYAMSPLFNWCEKQVQSLAQSQIPIAESLQETISMDVNEDIWYHNFIYN